MHEVPVLVTEIEGQARQRNPASRAPKYRISLVKDAGSMYVTSKPITSARMIVERLQELFEDFDREAFYVLCLDKKLRIIGVNLVSIGSLSLSLVHPREVFKAAILLNSSSIICVHNHPSSGNPAPSADDVLITERLSEAGNILGIHLQDHVIIGENAYHSFQEQGWKFSGRSRTEIG